MSADLVRDNEALSRYEIEEEGEIAFLEYRRREHIIVLQHTEVPVALRGRDLGSRLARHALDTAEAAGLRIVIRCPFVRAWVQRHPEYAHLRQGPRTD